MARVPYLAGENATPPWAARAAPPSKPNGSRTLASQASAVEIPCIRPEPRSTRDTSSTAPGSSGPCGTSVSSSPPKAPASASCPGALTSS